MFGIVNATYRSLLAEHGDSAAAVGIPKDNQALRYDSVTKFFHPRSRNSVLDYGCGLAHFYDYLSEQGFHTLDYLGVDINSDLLDRAQFRHPAIQLTTRDGLVTTPVVSDYVVAIGTFNLVYDTRAEQQEFVFEEIKLLFELTRKALFLNFMHTEVDFEQSGAWHQSVGELFRFAKKFLSTKVTIDSSYLPYEFTAVIEREH